MTSSLQQQARQDEQQIFVVPGVIVSCRRARRTPSGSGTVGLSVAQIELRIFSYPVASDAIATIRFYFPLDRDSGHATRSRGRHAAIQSGPGRKIRRRIDSQNVPTKAWPTSILRNPTVFASDDRANHEPAKPNETSLDWLTSWIFPFDAVQRYTLACA